MEEEMNLEKFTELGEKASNEKRFCIAMFQDADGNWRGVIKNKIGEQELFVRSIGPETVLQELLTHDGK